MRSVILTAVLLALPSVATATDWLTLPSTYSHDPVNGARVSQYAPIETPTAPGVSNFRTSGYTHTRSSLNFGQSADNYHRVERWGDPVRPYGEWRFPYRPFSTPYPNWGAPFAGLNTGIGWGFPNRFGNGIGGGHGGRPGPHGDENPDVPKPGHRPGHPNKDRGLLGGGQWPSDRDGLFPRPQGPLNPYPAGAGTPYPVSPYYDGYNPVYRD